MELLIVDSIKNKLEESNNLLLNKQKSYYCDVLDFMNLMFEDNKTQITSIKFKKITLNDNIFSMYNEIIKKYNLSKPEFIIDQFNLDEIIDDPDMLKKIFFDVAIKLSNNLIEKLNYRLKKKIDKTLNKPKIILEYIN